MALISLGCAKNQVDSEIMLAQLAQAGFQPTDSIKDADVIIVNSCGFIESAKRESLAALLEAGEDKRKEARLILAGCLSQGYGRDLAVVMPEVDAFVGPGLAGEIVGVVKEVLRGRKITVLRTSGDWETLPLPRLLSTASGTAYLKVAEGCSHHCSFCSIPRLRGSYRSRPEEAIMAEAGQLAAQGIKEIVLIAQDSAAYGIDRYGEARLGQLLRNMAEIDGIQWIRLLYLFPTHITDDLIQVMLEEAKVCRYFDLPLQHCSADILARMGRPPLRQVLPLINKVRELMPDSVWRSTFIVGFPGETDRDFQELCTFLRVMSFDWVGAFTFSPEEETRAALMPHQVEETIKKERWNQLMRIQRDITAQKLRSWVGREIEVLVESGRGEDGNSRGRTRGQAPEVDGVVLLKGDFQPGRLVRARVIRSNDYDLVAEPANGHVGQTLPAV